MSIGTIFLIILLTIGVIGLIIIWLITSLDKENPLAEQEDENEYQLLQKELSDTLFIDAGELHPSQLSVITRNAATFVLNRNMAFYRNGFENGVKAYSKGSDPIDPNEVAYKPMGGVFNQIVPGGVNMKHNDDQTTT